ncbi:hypothetical protein RRG08_027390 [Elysia crispata]|uniref:Uncharacterized protein n=1 Tax=Elysia crispata TaxID=231223 RepID=A0AAE1CXH2_9GAST|nr:hypothetical protein RRG08_027390 [Elysia crispata]
MLITYIVLITCDIAIQTCLVTVPLHFKGDFTVFRTKIAIAVLVLTSLLCHFPVLVTQGFTTATDDKTNTTRQTTWLCQNRNEKMLLNNTVSNIVYPVAELTSVITLSNELRESATFRDSVLTAKLQPNQNGVQGIKGDGKLSLQQNP